MRSRIVTHGVVAAAALAAVVGLAGCTPSAVLQTVAANASRDTGDEPEGTPYDNYPDDSGYSESGFVPVEVDGPVDWQTLGSCDDGSGGSDWVLVDTFPATKIDDAGIFPFCGDTFIADDGDDFVGAVATTTQYEIFLLGGKLTSDGWVLATDDFDPVPYEGSGEYVGARDYTRGDATLVISAYDNGVRPVSLTVFLDYYSPETRALTAASQS